MEMSALYKTLGSYASELFAGQIENYEMQIRDLKKKIIRAKKMQKLSETMMAELSKPPKPFKMAKMNKAQRRAQREYLRNMGMPTAIVPTRTVAG